MLYAFVSLSSQKGKKILSLCTARPKLYTILMKMRWKIMNFLHFCIIKYNICSFILLLLLYFSLPCFTYLTQILYIYISIYLVLYIYIYFLPNFVRETNTNIHTFINESLKHSQLSFKCA